MRYVDKSIRQFINQLAAKTPVPGGGSVAAMLGALGCGLLNMVANYTLSRPGFNGYKERAKKVLKESEKLRMKLTDLIDKDIWAYERLSKALCRHKDDIAAIQSPLKKAIAPLSQICLCVHKAAILSLELSYVGNKPLMPDVSTAIYVLDAAFESALVNIKTNLKDIRDRQYVLNKIQRLMELHRDMKKIKTDVLSQAKAFI